MVMYTLRENVEDEQEIFVHTFFFFKQKTAYEMRISDWSSDVCSSDLENDMDRENRVNLRDAKIDVVGVIVDIGRRQYGRHGEKPVADGWLVFWGLLRSREQQKGGRQEGQDMQGAGGEGFGVAEAGPIHVDDRPDTSP